MKFTLKMDFFANNRPFKMIPEIFIKSIFGVYLDSLLFCDFNSMPNVFLNENIVLSIDWEI